MYSFTNPGCTKTSSKILTIPGDKTSASHSGLHFMGDFDVMNSAATAIDNYYFGVYFDFTCGGV